VAPPPTGPPGNAPPTAPPDSAPRQPPSRAPPTAPRQPPWWRPPTAPSPIALKPIYSPVRIDSSSNVEPHSDDDKRRSFSDEELIQRVQAGNVRAFDEVVRRLTPPLFALAYRVLEDRHDAEEAVQDVFLKGFEQLHRYDPARPFFPWIYTIALNHVRSLRRRPVFRRRRDALPVDEEILAGSTRRPGSFVADQATPESGGPEDATLQAETARIIRGALASLRPIERQVFTLRQYEGLSTDATARVLRIRPNTVKTHLRRGRAKIIDSITGDETSSWVLAYKREKGE